MADFLRFMLFKILYSQKNYMSRSVSPGYPTVVTVRAMNLVLSTNSVYNICQRTLIRFNIANSLALNPAHRMDGVNDYLAIGPRRVSSADVVVVYYNVE